MVLACTDFPLSLRPVFHRLCDDPYVRRCSEYTLVVRICSYIIIDLNLTNLLSISQVIIPNGKGIRLMGLFHRLELFWFDTEKLHREKKFNLKNAHLELCSKGGTTGFEKEGIIHSFSFSA